MEVTVDGDSGLVLKYHKPYSIQELEQAYQLLGVEPSATDEYIGQEYESLSIKHHPNSREVRYLFLLRNTCYYLQIYT